MTDNYKLVEGLESDFNSKANVKINRLVASLHAPEGTDDNFISVVFYPSKYAQFYKYRILKDAQAPTKDVPEIIKQQLFSKIQITTGLEARMV